MGSTGVGGEQKSASLSEWARAREARRKGSLFTSLTLTAVSITTLAASGRAFIAVVPLGLAATYLAMYLIYRHTLHQGRMPALMSAQQLRSFAPRFDRYGDRSVDLLGALAWEGDSIVWRPRQAATTPSVSFAAQDVAAWNVQKVWGVAVPNYYVHLERRDGATVDFWTHHGPTLLQKRPDEFPLPT